MILNIIFANCLKSYRSMNKIDSKILYIHSMDSHCSYEKEVLDQCALNNIHTVYDMKYTTLVTSQPL